MVSDVIRDADQYYAISFTKFLIISSKFNIFCQNSWPYKGIYKVKTTISRKIAAISISADSFDSKCWYFSGQFELWPDFYELLNLEKF